MINLNDIKQEFINLNTTIKETKQKRNDLVIALYKNDFSLSQIAKISGLNLSHCKYIVKN